MNTGRTLKVILAAVVIVGVLLLIWIFSGSKDESPILTGAIAPLGNPIVSPRLAGNWGRVILVAADGTLWGWGDSSHGELGVRTNEICGPRLISGEHGWKEAATGAGFAAALKTDGTLWIWGADRYVATNHVESGKPVQFGSDTNWIHVAAGASHCIAQRLDGTLWTWGANNEGQLGDGTTTDSKDLVQIGTGPWKTVAAGAFHAAAIAPDGTLWDWGRHSAGGGTSLSQVGDETNWVAVFSGEFHTVAQKSDGSWWIWGDNAAFIQAGAATFPVRIPGTQSWVSVAGGHTHTVALGADGSLWAFGRNSQGEVGDGTWTERKSPVRVGTATNWIAIAAVGNTSAAMADDGRVLVWGLRLDIPPRTGHDLSPGKLLSRLLRFLNGRSSSGPVKVYSNSAQPVDMLQFKGVGEQDTNASRMRPVSPPAPPSGEH